MGVSARSIGESRSALRINCIARNGDPEEESTDFGLGVEIAKDGRRGLRGSGVREGNGVGVSVLCTFIASTSDAELIHFSSGTLARGGESGRSLNASAKCSLMNLTKDQS